VTQLFDVVGRLTDLIAFLCMIWRFEIMIVASEVWGLLSLYVFTAG